VLPEFDLHVPATLSEALEVMAEVHDVIPLAGGTSLLVDLRSGRRRAGTLMDVGRLAELRGVHEEDGHVLVGATTTIAELLRDPLVAEHGGVLRDACRLFAAPPVRNRATVGGNLADASPAADAAPPLLVLDAEVLLKRRDGMRRIPLSHFFTGVRETIRRPDELLLGIRFPKPFRGTGFRYKKLGLRKADAISVLSVAATAGRWPDGEYGPVRIALGAVAPTPIRVPDAEACLSGRPLTEDAIAEAARLCGEATRAIDDVRGSAAYRRRAVEAIVRRLLRELADGTMEET